MRHAALAAAVLLLVSWMGCEAPTQSSADSVGDDNPPGSDEDAVDQGGSTPDKDTKGGDPGPVPSYSDNQAILDYCTAVVLNCPPVSVSTVPGDWYMVPVNDQGCTLYAPQGWNATIDGTVLNVTSDPGGTAGYFINASQVAGVQWNEVSLAELLKQELVKVYPDLVVLKEETWTDPYGMGLKIRVVSIKFTKGGVPTVGNFRVIFYECSVILNSCPLTASGTWVPLSQVESLACTLAQIDASLRCPSGGSTDCNEGSCDTSCKSMGYSNGYCSGDDCTCN